jgi:hypothetical protein
MRKFWKQRREDEIEQLLRANRAQPREEFATSLLQRLETKRGHFRPQRAGGRVLVAAMVTALAVGVGVAAGGTHVAGTSFSNLIHVGNSGTTGPNHTYKPYHDHYPGPGDHQYVVAVCHHLNNRIRPWVELYLPPKLAAFFVRFFPPDYIVGYDGNPDTCPP